MNKKKFIVITICLSILLTGITACGEYNADDKKNIIDDIVQEKDTLSFVTVNTMPKYEFLVPENFYSNGVHYRDMMISVASGNYSEYENANCSLMEYSNIFTLSAFDNSFSMSVYSPKTSLDLQSLTKDNVAKTIEILLNEMSFKVDDDDGYWGIDTNNEFYTDIKYDMEKMIDKSTDFAQKIMIPFFTNISYEEVNTDDKNSTTLKTLSYSGWVTLITPKNESTKLMMAYSLDNNETSITDDVLKNISESLTYKSDNVGTKTAFDEKELDTINKESQTAMEKAISNMGINTENTH